MRAHGVRASKVATPICAEWATLPLHSGLGLFAHTCPEMWNPIRSDPATTLSIRTRLVAFLISIAAGQARLLVS